MSIHSDFITDKTLCPACGKKHKQILQSRISDGGSFYYMKRMKIQCWGLDLEVTNNYIEDDLWGYCPFARKNIWGKVWVKDGVFVKYEIRLRGKDEY